MSSICAIYGSTLSPKAPRNGYHNSYHWEMDLHNQSGPGFFSEYGWKFVGEGVTQTTITSLSESILDGTWKLTSIVVVESQNNLLVPALPHTHIIHSISTSVRSSLVNNLCLRSPFYYQIIILIVSKIKVIAIYKMYSYLKPI